MSALFFSAFTANCVSTQLPRVFTNSRHGRRHGFSIQFPWKTELKTVCSAARVFSPTAAAELGEVGHEEEEQGKPN
ncbi:hypothetical protein CDL15_Pgr007329 [Punica granatum]|uniref:Uncharacterized protein n=1 Tax=Punica granatum TaxID=22663 RepID=A0A218X9U5_PUNGR|nr:hypothetical protein CDL15_Pgr007329 [Punica granatum]